MYTTRINLPILERVHKLISNYCRENVCCYTDSEKIRELCSYKAGLQNTCYYIDNRNIRGLCLYKVGLNLLEKRKTS